MRGELASVAERAPAKRRAVQRVSILDVDAAVITDDPICPPSSPGVHALSGHGQWQRRGLDRGGLAPPELAVRGRPDHAKRTLADQSIGVANGQLADRRVAAHSVAESAPGVVAPAVERAVAGHGAGGVVVGRCGDHPGEPRDLGRDTGREVVPDAVQVGCGAAMAELAGLGLAPPAGDAAIAQHRAGALVGVQRQVDRRPQR